MKKKSAKQPDPNALPISFETFRKPGYWERSRLETDHPNCFNGCVSVRKYRVTFEEIKEEDDVIYARLLKLWTEADKHHHYQPLKSAANAIGRDLPSDELGKHRKDRK